MPWTVRKGSGKKPYKIVKKTTGEIVGSSSSMAKAKASVRARYANAPEARHMSHMTGDQMMKKYKVPVHKRY